MEAILNLIFWLSVAFSVSLISLGRLWRNDAGVVVASAVFAILFVIFVRV